MNHSSKDDARWTYRVLLAGFGMVALGATVTADIWSDILRIAWHDEESSQVFLVPFVVAWLVWVRLHELRHCRRLYTWIGPLLVAAGWLVSVVGFHHAIQTFWHGGAVLVLVGCWLTIVGSDVLRRFLPAFAALVFLVPVPGMARQQIAIPLQSATAQTTHAALTIMGVQAEQSGSVLSINGVEVAVAEACNGMRMVFALFLVSYAFAFALELPSYARLLIVVTSPLAAILCNVIRLIPTVWLYGYYPASVAEKFHDVSGWVMLPIAFLLLMGITKLVRWALVADG